MNWFDWAFRIAMIAVAVWACWSTWRDANAPLPANAPDEERRPVFARTGGRREARLDIGLGVTSIFTAIGMASLAHDLVEWRDFFANFLDKLLAVLRFVFDLLPFHVPDAWMPMIAGLIGVLGLMARYNLVLLGNGLVSVRDSVGNALLLLLYAAFIGVALIVLGSAGSATTSLIGVACAMAGVMFLGVVQLRSRAASDRLSGFYAIQAVCWCVLWGLVIVFLGSKGLEI